MEAVTGESPVGPPDSHPPDAGSGAPLLLRARGMGRRLDGESWIWRGVDLELRSGELVTVRGATGAGKSLLLRSLAQLDPLQEGTMELLGRPAEAWSPTDWRLRVAYLHQTPVLLPGTVEANLREPFRWKAHRERSFERDRVVAHLEPLGRSGDWLRREVDGLSGGERQILALLRALMVGPSVLLLDEPTAALDPDATGSVERLVRSWLEREGERRRAVLWVTHDADQARRMGGRRLLLADGRLRPEPGRPVARKSVDADAGGEA